LSHSRVIGGCKPTLVVAADEMPNLPHVEPNMIGNYALAKIKEAVLSVTG
jgi:pyruvate dehydrogenase (quinone)